MNVQSGCECVSSPQADISGVDITPTKLSMFTYLFLVQQFLEGHTCEPPFVDQWGNICNFK